MTAIYSSSSSPSKLHVGDVEKRGLLTDPQYYSSEIYVDMSWIHPVEVDEEMRGCTRVPYVVPADFVTTGSAKDLWRQPFMQNMELLNASEDYYDTSFLTDAEYCAFMTWLCASGWDVISETRTLVEASESYYGVSRAWVPPAPLLGRFAALAPIPESAPLHAEIQIQKPRANKKPCTVLRFCKGGATCTEAGCRYVHGDTIPRTSEICSFGAACGASDPTGAKRSQCLRMHPGEIWDASMVIHRIV